jgi:hypothetical protein
MDVYESLSHTKWDCKYHGMRCTAYRDVCGVQEYAEWWADLPIGTVRQPRFAPHNQEGFNMAKHVSPPTMRCPSLATKRISPQP